MGDIGEYNQHNDRKQQEKADRQKWNTQVVEFLSEELEFKLVKRTDFHFSLFHKKKGRMDFWPSTGKAMWVGKQAFVINDIEAYLKENFKV